MRDRYVLDHAPKGPGFPHKQVVCKTGIYLQDGKLTDYPVTLVDGEFVLDEPDPARKKLIGESLLKAGFRHAGQLPDVSKEDEIPGIVVPDKLTEPARLRHPDSTEASPVDATVTVGKKKVDVVAGIVESEDPVVVRALLKKGYVLQNPHALERDAEPDKPAEEGEGK